MYVRNRVPMKENKTKKKCSSAHSTHHTHAAIKTIPHWSVLCAFWSRARALIQIMNEAFAPTSNFSLNANAQIQISIHISDKYILLAFSTSFSSSPCVSMMFLLFSPLEHQSGFCFPCVNFSAHKLHFRLHCNSHWTTASCCAYI